MLNVPLLTRQTQIDLPQAATLTFSAITKRFGDVLANDRISFEIQGGGIHAIVGENGAGKSTLTKILYGYYGPDAGSIFLNGSEVFLKSPSQARRMGIGMVHQQLALIPSLTGFENVILGDPKLPFAFSKKELEKKVRAKASELGFEIDILCPVSNLSIAERQKLEIFKLLWRNARVLILDEPTSQLTPFEAEDILSIVQKLAERGRIVILITHHIAEVLKFATRITVLRKGKCITTTDTGSLGSDELAKLMIDAEDFAAPRAASTVSGSRLMNLTNVSTGNKNSGYAISDINLDISSGEIIGIAAISGSGQTELGQVIAGLMRPTTGSVSQFDSGTTVKSSAFVSYIPSDQKQAVAADLPVSSNCFLKSVNAKTSQTLGFLKKSLVTEQAKQIIEKFDISPPIPDIPANALSGGNLQRLIIGRELATEAKVVVADNPCAGLDAATSKRVRKELRKEAENGRAVVLISPDMEELITTCDRIVVMFNGRICGEQKAGQFNYQSLALMMGGKS